MWASQVLESWTRFSWTYNDHVKNGQCWRRSIRKNRRPGVGRIRPNWPVPASVETPRSRDRNRCRVQTRLAPPALKYRSFAARCGYARPPTTRRRGRPTAQASVTRPRPPQDRRTNVNFAVIKSPVDGICFAERRARQTIPASFFGHLLCSKSPRISAKMILQVHIDEAM